MIDRADIRHRRSIRLRGYDYARNGAYFVTICTQSRACLFGDIVDGGMRLNDAGRMVQDTWDALPAHYPGIGIDACVVMPNHLHGIIIIDHVGATPRGRPDAPRGRPATAGGHADLGRAADMGHAVVPGQARGPAPTGGVVVGHDPYSGHAAVPGQARGPAPAGGGGGAGGVGLSLPDAVHRLKTLTTRRYIDGVRQSGWPGFDGRLWQRNYYEHIIRDEDALARIREYIVDNPVQWALDRENPARAGSREGDLS